VTLSAAILARFGDFDRFANLAGVRSFTGLVPKVDQSGTINGHEGPTKAGDPGLRLVLFLAADHARRADPQLAAKYYRLVVEQASTTTLLFVISPRRWLLGSQRAGGPSSITRCAT
jgi:transposase